MTYTLMSVPEDKEVWCTGFRFDYTKAGINCKPVQGSIHNKDYWNSKFKTKKSHNQCEYKSIVLCIC